MSKKRRSSSTESNRGPVAHVNALLEAFSQRVTSWVGSSWSFAMAFGLILTWAALGPFFGFSQTWQLFVNTGTTIATFLMVFLIQRSQNKEALAMEVKLNELLAAQQGASNELINVEDLTEEEVHKLHDRFSKLVEQLKLAADGHAAHSIDEAREAIDEAKQSMTEAKRSSGRKQPQGRRA